jgi:hypothetical protein
MSIDQHREKGTEESFEKRLNRAIAAMEAARAERDELMRLLGKVRARLRTFLAERHDERARR